MVLSPGQFTSVPNTTRVWLYVRSTQSVRIVLNGPVLTIYGPGDLQTRHEYADSITAMLEHSAFEKDLVADGWSLEQLTTERRSGIERRSTARGADRRRDLRLVQ
jgi:hypothetical protein